jgi:hypothetical protein
MERADHARPRLSLGRILATPGALACLDTNRVDATKLLWRHQHADWGELSCEDRRANDEAAKGGSRVLSSYPIGDERRIWIITEADRSATTLLLPSEY